MRRRKTAPWLALALGLALALAPACSATLESLALEGKVKYTFTKAFVPDADRADTDNIDISEQGEGKREKRDFGETPPSS